jgi:hypothetical protein
MGTSPTEHPGIHQHNKRIRLIVSFICIPLNMKLNSLLFPLMIVNIGIIG